MPKDLELSLRSAQVDSLYRHSNTYVVFHPLAGALFCWTFWQQLANVPVFIWLITICVLSAIRYFSAKFFQYGAKPRRQVLFWENLFILFGFSQACMYAYMWFQLIHPDTVITNSVIGLWIVGLSACSIVGYSANLRGLFAFFIPTVLPGAILLILQGGQMNIGIALSLFLYSIVITLAVLPVYRSIKRSVKLNFQLQREIESRKKAEQQLLIQSRQDGLTGLANRRHFDLTLQNEIRRSMRDGDKLSLILIDIDYFKQYNDCYGHVAGDTCLKTVADLLRQKVNRGGDLVARYGGEEFAVILPKTSCQQADEIARQLQQSLNELNIPHQQSELTNLQQLTISCGICCIQPDQVNNSERLIANADQALYQAKQQGRNRVVCYLEA